MCHRPQKSPFSNLATMWGHPPLLPTRAKRSKSGSFGDDPTSTCLKTVKICKKVKENRQNRQNSTSTCLKTGGPLRGPSGAPPGPSGPLRGPSGPPDFWCNRHCRTSPVVLEGFWGQVWPKIDRKPEKSEYRIANEPLSKGCPATYLGGLAGGAPQTKAGRQPPNWESRGGSPR